MKSANSRALKPVLIAGLIFIVLTLKDLLTEMVGGKIGENLQRQFPFITNAVLFYCLILILAIALIYTIFQAVRSHSKEASAPVRETVESDVNSLCELLKDRYLSRHEQKMDGRYEISLDVREDWKDELSEGFYEGYDGSEKVSEAFAFISKTFEKKGRLLIVGKPGAGKTVLLLRLALSLLGKADTSRNDPLPVIFNLAAWSPEYKKFDEWLIATLKSGEGLSEEFAETLLREGRIILLLDGLDELAQNETDEIAEQRRADCLKAINDYLDRGKKVVICCRAREFRQMQIFTQQDAPVAAKIEVRDLSKEQVVLALKRAAVSEDATHHVPATNLLRMFETRDHDGLLEVIRTPFYFNIALELFDQQLLEDKQMPTGEKEIQDYMVERFVERKTRRQSSTKGFKQDMTRRWLTRLAQLMKAKHKVTFELADLQPTDVANRWFYTTLFSWVLFVTLGVMSWLVFLFFALYYRSKNALVGGALIYFLLMVIAYWGGSLGGLFIGKNATGPAGESSASRIRVLSWLFWKRALFLSLINMCLCVLSLAPLALMLLYTNRQLSRPKWWQAVSLGGSAMLQHAVSVVIVIVLVEVIRRTIKRELIRPARSFYIFQYWKAALFLLLVSVTFALVGQVTNFVSGHFNLLSLIASVAFSILMLLIGIPLLIFSGGLDDEITTEDNLQFDFLRLFSPRYLMRYFFSFIRESFFWGALLSVVLLLAYMTIIGASDMSDYEKLFPPEYYVESLPAYVNDAVIICVAVGLGLAFLVGIPVLIFNALNGLKSTSRFTAIEKPRQRIYAGVLKDFVFTLATLFMLLLIGLIGYKTPFKALGGILIILSPIVLSIFLLSLFRHSLIRHTLVYLSLVLEKTIPFRIVGFLNYAVDVRILEKDGGHWRFRHQKLQDYFANPGWHSSSEYEQR